MENREKILAKIDATNDVPKKNVKNWLRARILVLLAAFSTAQGASGAARRDLKIDPKRPQELGKTEDRALCDALGRPWALFCDFVRILLIFDGFLIDFSLNLARCWFFFAWLSL